MVQMASVTGEKILFHKHSTSFVDFKGAREGLVMMEKHLSLKISKIQWALLALLKIFRVKIFPPTI